MKGTEDGPARCCACGCVVEARVLGFCSECASEIVLVALPLIDWWLEEVARGPAVPTALARWWGRVRRDGYRVEVWDLGPLSERGREAREGWESEGGFGPSTL
jgi:hypothetical protein